MTDLSSPAQSKPRLLFFYSALSGASIRADGFLAQVLQRRRNHNTFQIHRIDINQRPDLAKRFQITSAPAICVIDGNRVAARTESPRGPTELQQLLGPWLH